MVSSNFCIFIHKKIKYLIGLESEESVMSCMWSCYVEKYVSPGYRHYSASLCHAELLNLPWNEFYPGPQDIEGMCKVRWFALSRHVTIIVN